MARAEKQFRGTNKGNKYIIWSLRHQSIQENWSEDYWFKGSNHKLDIFVESFKIKLAETEVRIIVYLTIIIHIVLNTT